MADEALARAYPAKRATLDFADARFSDDGAYLALVLKNITKGDPAQVWLYELRSRRLIPVTDSSEGLEISDISWSKNVTLYVNAMRIDKA